MQFTLLTCLTALAALTSAYTPANTALPPSGNAIGHPELGELIPAGQSFTITWAPDSGEFVTLLLLRGASTNVVPILTIAEVIPNTGSYTWTNVPTTLEPDITGYGIQLIVEGSGAYQYSPQCGVRNDAYTPSGSSSSLIVSSHSSSPASADASASTSTTVTLVSTTAASTSTPAVSYMSATGTGNFSVPIVSPTRSMSVPATLQSTFSLSRTTSAGRQTSVNAEPAQATGAAAGNLRGMTGGSVVALLGAAAAAMLAL